jgi:hypothetical protein
LFSGFRGVTLEEEEEEDEKDRDHERLVFLSGDGGFHATWFCFSNEQRRKSVDGDKGFIQQRGEYAS